MSITVNQEEYKLYEYVTYDLVRPWCEYKTYDILQELRNLDIVDPIKYKNAISIAGSIF